MTGYQASSSSTQWSGLETAGMMEAKCSLMIQEDGMFDPRIKSLPRQRVLVYQDRGYNSVGSAPGDENFYVDFNGCTILQLEPAAGSPQRTMPITLTVGGRCIFTPENFSDFRVMMRTKAQSEEMNIAPNGNFDWPDVRSLLLCPLCGNRAEIPKEGDVLEHYWLIFYPLLQITVMRGSQMTLGTRTICRLTCLECMEDLMEGMTLKVRPAAMEGRRPRLSFTLPANEVLAEAGSASFLEDGPPRPETHPDVDGVLDAWTLYNLWEHSGAWEALQNDYRIVLSRSMHSDDGGETPSSNHDTVEPKLKDRLGKACGNPECLKLHGKKDPETGKVINLTTRCKECHLEYYCSKTCRDIAREFHRPHCLIHQEERAERREKKTKQVTCDTCKKRSAYTKMKKCSRCRKATYCSQECQRQDWNRHKPECQEKN
jgi:MYND finger